MRVIGTAGHVDHGKSTLVHALTGIDPDRLKEEKEREMTIDLGFAWLTLPSGERVGIVDVPGHKDFIKNMLAGVGGSDAARFGVAADEGVMPQTREHLAILDLLQVPGGVVALTKIDAVHDQDWLELVEADLLDVLEGTVLADAPIVHVSARTGEGLEDLVAALDTVDASLGQSVGPMLKAPHLPPIPSLVTTLINDLAAHRAELAIALDDYHAVDDMGFSLRIKPFQKLIARKCLTRSGHQRFQQCIFIGGQKHLDTGDTQPALFAIQQKLTMSQHALLQGRIHPAAS